MDKDRKLEKCFAQMSTFEAMIDHLKMEHNLTLYNILDYCQSCACIFHHGKAALVHYLTHAMAYREKNLTNHPNHEHCLECLVHFDSIDKAMNHFSREIEFDRESHETKQKTQKILNLLEEAAVQEEEELEAELEEVLEKEPMVQDTEDLFSKDMIFV